VLEASDGPELQIVGNVTLGKPNEVFTALRFFDSIAYAVTFEQTDPFYVISFEDPKTPTVLGELNVTGFSRYMHSTNVANTRILGVGQEADEFGQILGLQISLFDTTDPTNPELLDRYIVEEESDQWSSSSVEWDFESFRYLKIDEETGRIILPLTSHNSADGSYFDGFSVFAVSSEGISPLFNISHVENQGLCYYCAQLQDRSFVIDGNVITLKGHSARSHDLDTGSSLWSLDFAWESDDCCYWF
jgi:hypothetical protein